MSHEACPNRSKCSTCSVDNSSVEPVADAPPLDGWRFALVSLGLFLGPLVLALIGGLSVGPAPAAQLCGTVAGLGLGMIASVGIAGILRRVSKDI